MIFVSYSHADEEWRQLFATMSKPLSKIENIEFWSDHKLKAGRWEQQLQKAMQQAIAAVLMVSDSFLASDYIIDTELPSLLKRHQEGDLMVVWMYLEPCDVKRHPEILDFQAAKLGPLVPLASLTPWEAKSTMLRCCDMLDDFLKTLEQPKINQALAEARFDRVTDNVQLLAEPSRRDVEVFVFSPDSKWWHQGRIRTGDTKFKLYLGD